MTEDLRAVLDDTDKQAIMEAFKQMTPPDMSAEDKNAADQNKKLLIKAVTVVGAVFILGIASVAILSWVYRFSFMEMLKENIVVLLVAGSVEFVFLSFFARQFRSLDPNVAKLAVINSLKSYADQV